MIKGRFRINKHDILKVFDLHSAIKNDYPYNFTQTGSWLDPVYYHFDVPTEDDLNLIKSLMDMDGIRYTEFIVVRSIT